MKTPLIEVIILLADESKKSVQGVGDTEHSFVPDPLTQFLDTIAYPHRRYLENFISRCQLTLKLEEDEQGSENTLLKT